MAPDRRLGLRYGGAFNRRSVLIVRIFEKAWESLLGRPMKSGVWRFVQRGIALESN